MAEGRSNQEEQERAISLRMLETAETNIVVPQQSQATFNITGCGTVNIIYQNSDQPSTSVASLPDNGLCHERCSCLEENKSHMEFRHQMILTRQQPLLTSMDVGHITILVYLRSKFIISSEDFETIEKCVITYKQGRELMRILPRRGPNAFYTFASSFQENENRHNVKFITHDLVKDDLITLFTQVLRSLELTITYADHTYTNPNELTYEVAKTITSILSFGILTQCKKVSIIDLRSIMELKRLTTLYLHQHSAGIQNRVFIRHFKSVCGPSRYLPRRRLPLSKLYLINLEFEEDDLVGGLEFMTTLEQFVVIKSGNGFTSKIVDAVEKHLYNAHNVYIKPMTPGLSVKIDCFLKEVSKRSRSGFVGDAFFNGEMSLKDVFSTMKLMEETSTIEPAAISRNNAEPFPSLPFIRLTSLSLGSANEYINDRLFPYEELIFSDLTSLTALNIRYPDLVKVITFEDAFPDEETTTLLTAALPNLNSVKFRNASVIENICVPSHSKFFSSIRNLSVESTNSDEVISSKVLEIFALTKNLIPAEIDYTIRVDVDEQERLLQQIQSTLGENFKCRGIIISSNSNSRLPAEFVDINLIQRNIVTMHLIAVRINDAVLEKSISEFKHLKTLVILAVSPSAISSRTVYELKKLPILNELECYLEPVNSSQDSKLQVFLEDTAKTNWVPNCNAFYNGDKKLSHVFESIESGKFSAFSPFLPVLKKARINQFSLQQVKGENVSQAVFVQEYFPTRTLLYVSIKAGVNFRHVTRFPRLINTIEFTATGMPDEQTSSNIWDTFPNITSVKTSVPPGEIDISFFRHPSAKYLTMMNLNGAFKDCSSMNQQISQVLQACTCLTHLLIWMDGLELYLADLIRLHDLKELQLGSFNRERPIVISNYTKSQYKIDCDLNMFRDLESIYFSGVLWNTFSQFLLLFNNYKSVNVKSISVSSSKMDFYELIYRDSAFWDENTGLYQYCLSQRHLFPKCWETLNKLSITDVKIPVSADSFYQFLDCASCLNELEFKPSNGTKDGDGELMKLKLSKLVETLLNLTKLSLAHLELTDTSEDISPTEQTVCSFSVVNLRLVDITHVVGTVLTMLPLVFPNCKKIHLEQVEGFKHTFEHFEEYLLLAKMKKMLYLEEVTFNVNKQSPFRWEDTSGEKCTRLSGKRSQDVLWFFKFDGFDNPDYTPAYPPHVFSNDNKTLASTLLPAEQPTISLASILGTHQEKLNAIDKNISKYLSASDIQVLSTAFTSAGNLTDTIMNAAQKLLKYNPKLLGCQGLLDVDQVILCKGKPLRPGGMTFQVLRDENRRHWLGVFANLKYPIADRTGLKDHIIYIIDYLPPRLTSSIKTQLVHYFKAFSIDGKIHVQFFPITKSRDTFMDVLNRSSSSSNVQISLPDFGVHVIATLFDVSMGYLPFHGYDITAMRNHLKLCFANQAIELFPRDEGSKEENNVLPPHTCEYCIPI